MKSVLNRELVESLNQSTKTEFAKELNDKVTALVSTALADIAAKSPFISVDKCVFIPVNEVYTGALSQQSEYTYFFGIDNPQIAVNTTNRKNWWKFAWKEFKASWRIGRKKKYKKKKGEETPKIPEIEKYQLSDLKTDLMNRMANYVSESTMILSFPTHLSIIGSEDFGTGIKINIFVCAYDIKTDTYKIYRNNRNKFISFNFGHRFENLDKKIEWCGPMFVNMLKLINILYAKTYRGEANQIIVESLLYACPNCLFDANDVYKSFVNVANYIRFKDPKNIFSICDEKTPFLKDPVVSKMGNSVDYSRIISILDKFKF